MSLLVYGLGIVPIETVMFPGLSVPVPDTGRPGAKYMKSGALNVVFLAMIVCFRPLWYVLCPVKVVPASLRRLAVG